MNSPNSSSRIAHITIRVSGRLFEGHLAYLDQLVRSAAECQLRPLLSLAQLEELDHPAIAYLADGEHGRFDIISCPKFVRDWINQEKNRAAA